MKICDNPVLLLHTHDCPDNPARDTKISILPVSISTLTSTEGIRRTYYLFSHHIQLLVIF
jgi:hypothetical protein